MTNLRVVTYIMTLIFLSACGVKGKPQPPLTPVPIGRGEPTFSEATQDLNVKKKKPPKIEGDFEDKNDFPKESE